MPKHFELTDREYQAVVILARGGRRDDVAIALGMSYSGVAKILSTIYTKTDTTGTTQMVAKLAFTGTLRPWDVVDGLRTAETDGPAAQLIGIRVATELDVDKFAGLKDAYRLLSEKGL